MKVIVQLALMLAMSFLVTVNNAKASQKITVAFGEVMAPWVLDETNRGIVVDILNAAMTPLGYELDFVYLPYARRIKAYQAGSVDAVSDMNIKTITKYKLPGFFSDIAYSYENFAFSLKKNNFELTQIKDLKKHSVLSWQDAAVHLGPVYAEMVNGHSQYAETFDQSSQVRMLFLERFEVVQMDGNIFDYYRKKLLDNNVNYAQQDVDRFALLGASPNGFLFRSEKIRDDFNQQLRWLKSTGQYKEIYSRYF